jgi:hypothetical protein
MMVDVEPFKTLPCQWTLSEVLGMHHVAAKLWPRFWQLIGSNSVSISARSFVRSPPLMQPSCSGLSLVIRGGFTVITYRDKGTVLLIEKSKSPRPNKRSRQVKSKVKSMFIIFFGIKGVVTNNSSWQAKQSIPHSTVMFYDDCVKMCEHFALNFGNKRTHCCIMTTHHLTIPFSPGNFWPKTTWLSSPTHPTFLCFPDWR